MTSYTIPAFIFVLLCSSSVKNKWLLGVAFSASSLNVECCLFKILWLSAPKPSVKWLPVVCVCVHVYASDGLLLRPTTVCSVSAVRMKTLSISTQQQLFLTSFCLTPNALQLSIRLLLCLAVRSSPSCCFRAASCPCNPRIGHVLEIHLGGWGGGLDGRVWVGGGWVACVDVYCYFPVKCHRCLSLHIQILSSKNSLLCISSLSFLLYLWKLPGFVPS